VSIASFIISTTTEFNINRITHRVYIKDVENAMLVVVAVVALFFSCAQLMID
jgi:hypothetical protein